MTPLSEFEAAIDRLEAEYRADPNGVVEVTENLPGEFEGEWDVESREEDRWLLTRNKLSDISVSIRRALWRDMDVARALADRADRLASEISAAHGDTYARQARFPASYSDCSGWSQRIE